MIPILYEANETAFVSNGLGRLRDTISARVVEERNSIYELDFDYPVSGAHYEDITLGRIVAVSHDDTGNIQPFDIVSYTKPLNGVVTFHCVHVSYRQSQLTTSGTNINSLADAFTMLGNASPANPFTYQTDITSSAYMASADGTPRTVRQFLGGIEGSILDTYGGEYEWDRFNVILHRSRGVVRDWSIRYGVNLLNAQDDVDSQSTYTSCIPYWTGSDSNGAPVIIQGNKVDSGLVSVDGRDRCIPLDLTDKFESQPTTAQLESAALAKMTSGQVNMPAQTLKVDFVRLQDMPEFADIGRLLACSLCDTITVILPTGQGQFKIVRTVWNVLLDKYDEMELGTLSTTLAEALGITTALEKSTGIDQVVSQVQALAQIVDKLVVSTPSVSVTATTGSVVTTYARLYGNVMVLQIVVRNTSTVASGSNIFVGTITDSAYHPAIGVSSGMYYGARATNAFLTAAGVITIRNASTSAMTMGSSDTLSLSFTYLVA